MHAQDEVVAAIALHQGNKGRLTGHQGQGLTERGG